MFHFLYSHHTNCKLFQAIGFGTFEQPFQSNPNVDIIRIKILLYICAHWRLHGKRKRKEQLRGNRDAMHDARRGETDLCGEREVCQMSVRDVELISCCSPQGIREPRTDTCARTHCKPISRRTNLHTQTILVWIRLNNWSQCRAGILFIPGGCRATADRQT